MPKKGEVEEYEVGTSKAPQQPKPSSSGTSALIVPDFLNPYEFSLVRVNLQRGPNQPLGFDVKTETNGALKVISVDGQAAAATGIEKESYLLSMDGKRITSEAAFKQVDKSNRHAHYVALAKKRASPLESSSFPLPESVQRQPGRQYFLIRLDPTDGKNVGTGIGEKNGVVCVTQVVENSAGSKAGVRVGDRVLAVDGTRVESRERCRTLVLQTMGNPFDMIIERGPLIATSSQAPAAAGGPKPTPTPAPTQPPILAPLPPPPDPNAGDPSVGVPTTPKDVSVFLESKAKKTLDYIRLTQKKEKPQPKQQDSVYLAPKKATVSKQVTKEKLRQ